MATFKCCEWYDGYNCECDNCAECPNWFELLDAGEVEWSLLDDTESDDCWIPMIN